LRWLAASVHTFTALGAVCALFATLAVFQGTPEQVFFWLAAAFFVDGVDGTLARAVGVKEVLPRFSGDRLDLIIDYLTYVFVPVLALLRWNYLSGTTGMLLASGIVLSSLYHFADTESKTKDNCFVGFPAIWNIVAYYVFALAPPEWLTKAAVAIFIALTFVPMPWVHPVRVHALRAVSLLALAAFSGCVLWTIYAGFPASPIVEAILLAVAISGPGLAVVWWLKGSSSPAA